MKNPSDKRCVFRTRVAKNSYPHNTVVFSSDLISDNTICKLTHVHNPYHTPDGHPEDIEYSCEREMKGTIRLFPMPYYGHYEFELFTDKWEPDIMENIKLETIKL